MEKKPTPTGIFFCTAQGPDLHAALGAMQEGIKAEDFSTAKFEQLFIQQVAIASKIAGRVEVQYCVVAVMRFPESTTAMFKDGLTVS